MRISVFVDAHITLINVLLQHLKFQLQIYIRRKRVKTRNAFSLPERVSIAFGCTPTAHERRPAFGKLGQ